MTLSRHVETVASALILSLLMLLAVSVVARSQIPEQDFQWMLQAASRPVASAAVDDSGPIIWYKMNGADTNVTQLLDSSGVSPVANASNKPDVANGPILTNMAPYAYQFVSAGADHFNMSTNKHTSGQVGSVSLWMRNDVSWGAYYAAYGEGATSGPQIEISLGTINTGKGSFYMYNVSGYAFSLQTPAGLPTGEWIHICGTYTNGGAAILYQNGTNVASNLTIVIPTNAPAKRCVGRVSHNLWPNFFSGYIDDVRIYNRVLASNEVYNLTIGGRVAD